MGMNFQDKLKLMKILSSEEGRDKFKEMFELKFKSQNAQQATAKCIAEGLAGMSQVTEVTLSAGEAAFLPLTVTVTVGGETTIIKSVQPDGADFDYDDICAQFNELIAENDDEKPIFLQKTAAILEGIINENSAAAESFAVKIR